MTVSEVRFRVRLTPRGGLDRVDGLSADGTLLARVAAPAADGAANASLMRLLAGELGLPRSAVTLLAGAASRRKTIGIDPALAPEILARWPGLALLP
jgi:uncharacterized protein